MTLLTGEPQERLFMTSDGVELFFRHRKAVHDNPQRGIVVLHRGHEHSGCLQHIVDELAMPDTIYYAWDACGYGTGRLVRRAGMLLLLVWLMYLTTVWFDHV